MARTAKLEIEVDSRRARAGSSAADRELAQLKRTARGTVDELRQLGRNSDILGTSLRGAGRNAGAASGEFRKAGAAASGAARDMQRMNRESSALTGNLRAGFRGVDAFASGMLSLRGAATAVIALGIANTIVQAADATKQWNAQLLLAVPASTSLATAQSDVRRIAGETRNDMGATTDLYAKFSRAAQELGKDQAGAARATETFAKTLKISGAGAAESESATRQFGQALASGVLRGDEFNSVMENSPRLARLLATSMGQPIGKLREMAADGQLTADKLYAALTDRKFTAAIDAEFDQIPVTFGEAMQRVQDTATVTFGAFDRGGEFSNMLIEFMLGGVENMDSLEKRAEDLGIELRSTFAGLYDVFVPLYDGAVSVFDMLDIRIASTRDQIAGIIGIYDSIQNADIWFDRKYQEGTNALKRGGVLSENVWGGQVPLTPWSDKAGEFTRGYDRREATQKGAQAERNFLAKLPRQFQYDSPTELADAMAGRGRFAPPKTGGVTEAGKEIGRIMSGADLDKRLASIGAVVTSRERTEAQQRALIAKWEREDPRTRGIRPADPKKSDHVGGVARDIAKGRGISLDTITAAVGKENIKQLLDEGDHFHLALKGKGGGRGGKTDAEREADRMERLRKKRSEDEADFWQQLQDQGRAAAMLPLEAEKFNAELKLRKILNDGNVAGERELTKAQKQRIADLIAEKNLKEFIGEAGRQQLSAEREAARQQDIYNTLSKSTLETEADNLAIQERVWPLKLDALTRGLDLQDATVKKAIAEAEARERTNLELEKRNRLVTEGVSVAREYGGPQYQQKLDRQDLEDKKVAAAEAVWAGRISQEVYEQTVKGLDNAIYEVDNRFRFEFVDSIDRLASHFHGKFGEAVSDVARVLSVTASMAKGDFSNAGPIGAIIDVLGSTKNGDRFKLGAQEASRGMLDNLFSAKSFNPIMSLTSSLKDFKGDLRNVFGKGGDFAKGAGAILGKAAMGSAIGDATNSVLGALGIKLNKTGSSIGGGIGGAAFGPLGAIGGSILGGVVGNLFAGKAKPGGVTVSNVGGQATVGAGFGDSVGAKAGSSLGGSVVSGLNSIVEQLGGTLGTFSVQIGKYKDDLRVNVNGRALGGVKGSGATGFGDDEEAAVRFAIAKAIEQGAIQGLSPTVKRAFDLAGDNFEKGIADALKLKSIRDELRSIEDPVNFALETLNKGFTEIVDLLRAAGGTAEEFADAEKLYQLKRKDIIEQGNNSSLKEMRDYLFQLRGGTSSVLSPELRYSTSRAELDALDAQRASGGKVDFQQYRTIADAFLASSRESNGSGLTYFADLKRVTDTLDSWIGTVNQAAITAPPVDFTPVVSAVQDQTTATTALLREIADNLSGGGYGGYSDTESYAQDRYAVMPTETRYFGLN